MIRTGEQYRNGLRDGREIWIDGERVKDVTRHPATKPIVDIRARMYDMQHEDKYASTLTYVEDNKRHSIFNRLPREQKDWHDKWAACDAVMNDIKGVVTRVGDETVGEMWSLYDGRNVLNEIDPRFGDNIANHIQAAIENDPFHVSANTDPKGDRSKAPQDQDPDMMVHVVKETDAGIIIRGAKYETASGYSDQAFLKPTVGAWTNEQLSDYAIGGIVKMGAPGVKHIARSGFAGRNSAADYPLANKFDEVDFLMVLDNVLIPWEDVFFYRHTKAAQYIRGTLHRYSAFPYMLRILYYADMMIGAAMWNAKQTGLDKLQAVREKLADLVCYREGINAHLTARDRRRAEKPRRPADAEPADALCRPRLRLLEPAADDAYRARTLRRTDLRHAERGRVQVRGLGKLAREILLAERQLAGRGPAQAARLRARPAELRLCRPPADLHPVRAGAAFQSSGGGL